GGGVPLHGGAGPGPVVAGVQHAALGVGQARQVAQANLIAVVDGRQGREREQEGEGGRQLLRRARPGAQAGEVVVGGGQRDVPGRADRGERVPVGGQERTALAAAADVEVAGAVTGPLGAVGGGAVAPQRAQRP